MQRILFLDVDGVLNRNSTVERIPGSMFLGLDHRNLSLYNNWIAGKPIDVVLSSTWRHDENTRHYLIASGVSWIGVTPYLHSRGAEIHAYMTENDLWSRSKIAILDDLTDLAPVGRYLVQTSPRCGVEHKHFKRIERLLDL